MSVQLPPVRESEGTTFSPELKDAALKVLINYSLLSGKKWSRICAEILQTIGITPSDHAPLLIRQDLEHWGNGASVIRDAKFRLVWAFLTHPTVLARPEFAAARALLGQVDRVRRTGRTVSEFYGAELRHFNRGPRDDVDWLIGKTFESRSLTPLHTLSFFRADDDPFYVVHAFEWRSDFLPDDAPRDFHVARYAGFAFFTPHGARMLLKHQRTGEVGDISFYFRTYEPMVSIGLRAETADKTGILAAKKLVFVEAKKKLAEDLAETIKWELW